MLAAACIVVFSLNCRGQENDGLRQQLKDATREAGENPEAWHSVAEISRRILLAAPQDEEAWESMARAQLKVGDLERCKGTLASWAQIASPLPAVADDIAGDLAFAQNDSGLTVKEWILYLQSELEPLTLEKLAWAYELQGNWLAAIATLEKRIQIGDTAGPRVWLARCCLRLRKWDDAYAQMDAANKLDASDGAVKAWLPRFELLKKYLPAIKGATIPNGAAGVNKLLDRALLFAEAGQLDLALEDDARALKLAPASRRALLQNGYALISMNRRDEAAALNMNTQAGLDAAARDSLLLQIGDIDLRLASKRNAVALVDRAWRCNELLQFALALDDAREARKLAPTTPPPARLLLEEGFALEKIGHGGDAMKIYSEATLSDPKNATAWRYRGEAELRRANYPPAIDFLSRSLAIREAAPVLLERAKCYRATGRRVEAKWDFDRYQDLLNRK